MGDYVNDRTTNNTKILLDLESSRNFDFFVDNHVIKHYAEDIKQLGRV